MDYKLNDVIEELETSAKEALKDGGTSNWGHRTLQVVEWLKDYREFLKSSSDSCETITKESD
jgi:hypothetical protein